MFDVTNARGGSPTLLNKMTISVPMEGYSIHVIDTLKNTQNPDYKRPGLHLYKVTLKAASFKGDLAVINQFIGAQSTVGVQGYYNPGTREFDFKAEFKGHLGYEVKSIGGLSVTDMVISASQRIAYADPKRPKCAIAATNMTAFEKIRGNCTDFKLTLGGAGKFWLGTWAEDLGAKKKPAAAAKKKATTKHSVKHKESEKDSAKTHAEVKEKHHIKGTPGDLKKGLEMTQLGAKGLTWKVDARGHFEKKGDGKLKAYLQARTKISLLGVNMGAYIRVQPHQHFNKSVAFLVALQADTLDPKKVGVTQEVASDFQLNDASLIIANYDAGIKDAKFRAGITMTGAISGQPSFLNALNKVLGKNGNVKFEKAHIAAWFPAAWAGLSGYASDSDFAIRGGVSGEIKIASSAGTMRIMDPAINIWSKYGAAYFEMVVSGSFSDATATNPHARFFLEFKKLGMQIAASGKTFGLSMSGTAVYKGPPLSNCAAMVPFVTYIGNKPPSEAIPQPPDWGTDDLGPAVRTLFEDTLAKNEKGVKYLAPAYAKKPPRPPKVDCKKDKKHKDCLSKQRDRFFMYFGPASGSLPAHMCIKELEIDELSTTVSFTKGLVGIADHNVTLPASVAKQTGIKVMQPGLTIFTKVGYPAGSTMEKVMKAPLLNSLPKTWNAAFHVNSKKLSIDLWLDPAKPFTFTEYFKDSLGVLSLVNFRFTLNCQWDPSWKVAFAMYGRLQLSDTFFGGPPFLFPGLSATVDYNQKTSSVGVALALSTEKLLLLPDPKYPVYFGPIDIVCKYDSSRKELGGFVFAAQGTIQGNVLPNLLHQMGKKMGILEPLMTIMAVMLNVIIGGLSIKVTMSTSDQPIKFTMGGKSREIESKKGAGLCVELQLKMSDAMKMVGLPPITDGTIFAKNNIVDMSDVGCSVGLTIPWGFFTEGSLPGPVIFFSGTGPMILNTIQLKSIAITLALSTSGVKVTWDSDLRLNMRKCKIAEHGYACVATGMLEGHSDLQDLPTENFLNAFENGQLRDNKKKKWVEANWLNFNVYAAVDTLGVISLGGSMENMWEDAMGMPYVNIGKLFAAISIDVPQCSASIATAAASMGAGAVDVLRACIAGFGLGGAGELKQIDGGTLMSMRAYAYFSTRKPEEFFVDLGGKNIGLGGIATWGTQQMCLLGNSLEEALVESSAVTKRTAWEDFCGFLGSSSGVLASSTKYFDALNLISMPTLEVFGAAVDGQVGNCPGPFPKCIKFKAGFGVDFMADLFGIQVGGHLSFTMAPPDVAIGFTWDMTLLDQWMESIYHWIGKVFPIRKEIIEAFDYILTIFGFVLPFPLLKINILKMRKMSLVKFLINEDNFALEWDITIFGERLVGSIELSILDFLGVGGVLYTSTPSSLM
jgi:hypothetical protein